MNMKIREILAVLAVSALCGCTDFLDVVPDNIATIEMAFNNRANAEKYLATCYAPVSYTHLDVYKRQILGTPSCG